MEQLAEPSFANIILFELNFGLFQETFCPARARSACALRALGLLLADGAPTAGRGKTFSAVNQVFFYENCCISGTESQKIVPKVGNERSLRGLQTGR